MLYEFLYIDISINLMFYYSSIPCHKTILFDIFQVFVLVSSRCLLGRQNEFYSCIHFLKRREENLTIGFTLSYEGSKISTL